MKTLTTLAAALLAVLLTLGPTVAFAAASVTVQTDSASYSGSATIHVTGTVSPAPTTNTAVFITIKGPSGAVDFAPASVSTATGAYSATFVAGSSSWVTGTYTVNATWGASAAATAAFATTTFQYTASTISSTGGGGGAPKVDCTVQATTPAWAGQTIQVAVLTWWDTNGSLASANFKTVHYHTPQGTLVTLGTPTSIHKGFVFWTQQLPTNATDGTYFIHAWVQEPNGVQGQCLGSFTVNSAIASSSSVSALSNAVSQLSSSVQSISSSLSGVTSAANDAKTAATNAANAVNGLTSTVNSIQSTVNTINSGVSGLSSLSGLPGQVSSLSASVSNSQTYVLVVAALAAITLVLELAILVRKLS